MLLLKSVWFDAKYNIHALFFFIQKVTDIVIVINRINILFVWNILLLNLVIIFYSHHISILLGEHICFNSLGLIFFVGNIFYDIWAASVIFKSQLFSQTKNTVTELYNVKLPSNTILCINDLNSSSLTNALCYNTGHGIT